MPSAFTVREREGKEEEEQDAGRLQVGSAWMPAWITTREGERRRLGAGAGLLLRCDYWAAAGLQVNHSLLLKLLFIQINKTNRF